MRRLFCLMLCALLALGQAALCEAAVEAAEAATEAVEATEPAAEAVPTEEPVAEVRFSEADAGFEGEWVPFEDGFRLYLPREWRAFELTDEQTGAGLFYRAGSDGAGEAMGVAVGYAPAGALSTPEDLERDYAGGGFEAVGRLDVNGIPAVGFERPADGYRGEAFYHPSYPGYVLTVYVTPVGGEESQIRAVGDAILASLSPFVIGE